MDGSRLDNDATALEQPLNVCAGVGVPDLGLLSGVEPDFAFANAGDGGGEPLLRAKVDHHVCLQQSQNRNDIGEQDGRSWPCS
jgi:hypothetical protein